MQEECLALFFLNRTVESNFTCTPAVIPYTAKGFYNGSQSFLTLVMRIFAAAHKTHSKWKKPFCFFTEDAVWLWCHKGHWYFALTKHIKQQKISTIVLPEARRSHHHYYCYHHFLLILWKQPHLPSNKQNIAKLSCQSNITFCEEEKKKEKKNAHTCSVASVGHCGLDALEDEACDHCFALRHCRHSRLQAVGQKRRAPGRCPVKRMTPEGSLFTPTAPSESGLLYLQMLCCVWTALGRGTLSTVSAAIAT